MRRALGPFNFNTNHEFGLLVEGFDSDPFVLNPHNSAYYPEVYESLGLKPAMDWYAYHVDASMPGIRKIRRVGERVLSRNPEITIRSIDLARFDEEVEKLHKIYDDAWEQNWAHVKVTDREFRFLAQGLKAIIDPDLCFVVEKGDETIGMSLTLPDFNQVVKKMKGRLFPFWLDPSVAPTEHDLTRACLHVGDRTGVSASAARSGSLRSDVQRGRSRKVWRPVRLR